MLSFNQLPVIKRYFINKTKFYLDICYIKYYSEYEVYNTTKVFNLQIYKY